MVSIRFVADLHNRGERASLCDEKQNAYQFPTTQRGQLNDRDNATWFNIFNVIFELVSAYGTVGLSLGVGYDNFS